MSDSTGGRYRKLYPRIWRHPGFQELSESAQRLALYILCGPQSNRCGVFHFSIATASEDLKLTPDTCRRRLADVCVAFGWAFDADARVFYVRSWWRWNPPENPSVLEGNLKDLNDVPPSALLEAFAANTEFIEARPADKRETWLETWHRCVTTRLQRRPPHQNQEQYQEQKQKQTYRASRGAEKQKTSGNGSGQPTESNNKLATIARETLKLYASGDLDILCDHFQDHARVKHRLEVKRLDALTALTAAIAEQRSIA